MQGFFMICAINCMICTFFSGKFNLPEIDKEKKCSDKAGHFHAII